MEITRRLRGVLGVATTWAVAFSMLATTVLIGCLVLGVLPAPFFGPRQIVIVALRASVAGALSGTLFATLLARTERRGTVAGLSAPRVALWGFLGGVCIPGAFAVALGVTSLFPAGVLVSGSILYGALGSVMGTTTIRIARLAPMLPGESGVESRVQGWSDIHDS